MVEINRYNFVFLVNNKTLRVVWLGETFDIKTSVEFWVERNEISNVSARVTDAAAS